jgi:hypothetical protein
MASQVLDLDTSMPSPDLIESFLKCLILLSGAEVIPPIESGTLVAEGTGSSGGIVDNVKPVAALSLVACFTWACRATPPESVPAEVPPSALEVSPGPVARPAPTAEVAMDPRIEMLLEKIAGSGVTFVRNGKEHAGAKAAAHLRAKWQSSGGRIRTAEEFIELIASRSSASGRPYGVRLPDGREFTAREWLTAQLAAPAPGRRAWIPEDVLALLRGSDRTFLRVERHETERRDGRAMASWIDLKYKLASAPPMSAEEFIRRFCTLSERHGTEYLVEMPDGGTRPLGQWLEERVR